MNRNAGRLLLGLVVAGGIRIIGLGSFPGVMADEGLWTSGAKNSVLFGDPFLDGRTHALLSPVFHALSVGVFGILGAKMSSARLVSALASILSIPLIYLLTRRVSGRRSTALTAAIIFGASAMYAFASRQAMIESTQILFLALSAAMAARGDVRGAILGGVAFGVGLLTKINSAYLLPVLALLCIPREGLFARLRERGSWTRMAVFGGSAIAVAGIVNALLYLGQPDLYVAAYSFEIVGSQFEPRSNPVVRFGRFGLDPELVGRSALALIREAPFQLVLAAMGAAAAISARSEVHPALWAWLLWGVGFVMLQNFQPIRYFFLTAPAFCYFAALAIDHFGEPLSGGAASKTTGPWSSPRVGVLVAYVLFNLSYLGMNAAANRDDRLSTVREWVASNTDPSDRLISASYFAVDVPNLVYGHYHLGHSDVAALAESIDTLDVTYVIYDDREWAPDAKDQLEGRYEKVQEWPFGAVFRVND